jgi:hypothetical protein
MLYFSYLFKLEVGEEVDTEQLSREKCERELETPVEVMH